MKEYLLYSNASYRFPNLPVVLDGVGIMHRQESVVRVSGINAYQWIQSVKGSGRLILAGKTYNIEAGCGIFLPANVPHEYYPVSERWLVHFLCFNGCNLAEMLTFLGLDRAGAYALADAGKIVEYMELLYQIYSSETEHKALKASKLLYSLLIDLALDITKSLKGKNAVSNQALNQAIHFMETHFTESISLEEIAQSVSLSKEYLCALFRKNLDISVFEYLQSIRLAWAKTYLLQFPQKRVKEIAAMVGYQDSSYFCAVFKKKEKMTPVEFRNMGQ